VYRAFDVCLLWTVVVVVVVLLAADADARDALGMEGSNVNK
jgi:hypothetical protein